MILTFLCGLCLSKNYTKNNLLCTLCFWSILVFFITEGLSVFHALNRKNIVILWGICSILSTILLIREFREKGIPKYHINCGWRKKLDIIFIIWLAVTGFMAWRMVPCNWDSMTYHMARVANWIQNQTVDYYATNIPRQLYSPIFAEYVILNASLVMGNDRAANMIQFMSYVFSAYFIYQIGAKLHFHQGVRYLTAVLFLTMPMAIAQSMTTQVDLVGCLWMLAFLTALLELTELKKLGFDRESILLLMECALTIGFGYLSKSTVCIGMLVFLIWLLTVRVKKKDPLKILLIYILIAGVIILSLAMPTFIRNYKYTGDILASDFIGKVAVGTISPSLLFINIYKNWALLSSKSILRNFLARGGRILAAVLKVDLNDPRISYTGDFYNELPSSYDCDVASCYVAALFFAGAVVIWGILFIVRKHKLKNLEFSISCLLSIVAGLVVIRYQVWGSRLLLPYSALMCIFDAYVCNELFAAENGTWRMRKAVLLSVGALCAVTAVPAVLYQARYLVSYNECKDRFRMYFANRWEEYEPYNGLCSYVEGLGAENIGIYLGSDTYEYPLWVRLKNDNTRLMQVVPENNVTGDMIPECIITVGQGEFDEGTVFEYAGCRYIPAYYFNGNKEYAVLIQ